MAETTLTIHIDADIKQDFDVFCENAGLNASVAINMFARAVLRERRIPFEIKTYIKAAYTEAEDGPFWNEANQQYLRRRIADVEAGRHCHAHSLITLDNDED